MTVLHPTGVNHLALSTRDMKTQLTFWSDVMGCAVKALYWMHGVEGTFHGFVELSPESYVAFVQHPDNPEDIELGVTHPGSATGPVTAGTMQHVALHADTFDDLLALRDRIRAKGVQVMGPIDHGMLQSIYFGGPEGLSLEVTTGSDIGADQWIDPEVVGLCGISDAEIEALKHPEPFESEGGGVSQPPREKWQNATLLPVKYHDAVMRIPDDVAWDRFSETTPPVEAG